MRKIRTIVAALAAATVTAALVAGAAAGPSASGEAVDWSVATGARARQAAPVYGWTLPEQAFDGTRIADRSGDVDRLTRLASGSFQVAFATTASTAQVLLAVSDGSRTDTFAALGLDAHGHVTYRVVDRGRVLVDAVAPGSLNDGAPHLVQVAVAGGQVTIDVDSSPVHADAAEHLLPSRGTLDSFTLGGRQTASSGVAAPFTGTIWRVSAHDAPLDSTDLAALAGTAGVPAEAVLADRTRIHELLTEADDPVTLLYTGDSITHGALWTDGWRSWTEHVDAALDAAHPNPARRVLNTAISGNTSTDVLDDFTERVTRWRPDLVTLMIGMNDFRLFDGEAGLPRFRENLAVMVDRIRALGAVPVLAASQPIQGEAPDSSGDYARYVAAIRAVAAERHVFMVDMRTDWLRATDGDPPASWWGNSIHPSARGHARFAANYLRQTGIWADLAALDIPADTAPADPVTALVADLTSPQVGVVPGGRATMTATVTAGDHPARDVALRLRPDPALAVLGEPTVTPASQVTRMDDGGYLVRPTAPLPGGAELEVELTATVGADAGDTLLTTAEASGTNLAGAAASATLRQAVVETEVSDVVPNQAQDAEAAAFDPAPAASADMATLQTLAEQDVTWLFTGDRGPAVTDAGAGTGGARSWIGLLQERQRWERRLCNGWFVDDLRPGGTIAGLLATFEERIAAVDADIVTIVTGAEAADSETYARDLAELIDRVRGIGAVPVLVLAQAGVDGAQEYVAAARAVAVAKSAVLVDLGTAWPARHQGRVPTSWLTDGSVLTGPGAANAAGQYQLARAFGQALGIWDADSAVGRVRFAPVSSLAASLELSSIRLATGGEVGLIGTVTAGSQEVRDGVVGIHAGPGLEFIAEPVADLGEVVAADDGYAVVFPATVEAGATIRVAARARVLAAPGEVVSAQLVPTLANGAGPATAVSTRAAVVAEDASGPAERGAQLGGAWGLGSRSATGADAAG